jgi:hypothetical protein
MRAFAGRNDAGWQGTKRKSSSGCQHPDVIRVVEIGHLGPAAVFAP